MIVDEASSEVIRTVPGDAMKDFPIRWFDPEKRLIFFMPSLRVRLFSQLRFCRI